MNLSLISSFIIGTILLLSLVKINIGLVQNSMDSMNDQMTKANIDNIVDVLTHDFVKIGYGVSGNSLVTATVSTIAFNSDLDNDGAPELVSWSFDTSQPVTESPNPDDYLLTRSVNGVETPIKLGVVKFELKYFDASRVETFDFNSIRRVEVTLVCEGVQPVNGKYMVTAWEKAFVPMSIMN